MKVENRAGVKFLSVFLEETNWTQNLVLNKVNFSGLQRCPAKRDPFNRKHPYALALFPNISDKFTLIRLSKVHDITFF